MITMIIQEKACLVPALPPPVRTKSYQAPSPPLPSKMALVRSASEDQAVLKVEEKEIVKEEVLWTNAMVQDMFDCLDQARYHHNFNHDPRDPHHHDHDPRSHHHHNHDHRSHHHHTHDSRSHHACNHANFQAREELDTTTSREVNPRWTKQSI